MKDLDDLIDDENDLDEVIEEPTYNFLSSGDINMFDTCPTKVYYAKKESSNKFVMDIGFHYATTMKAILSAVMVNKITSKKLPSLKEIWDLEYRSKDTSIGDYWRNYEDYGTWEDLPEDSVIETYHKKIESMSGLYLTQFASDVHPVAVDRRVHLPIPGGESKKLYLSDYLDLVGEDGVVYLYKYPSRSPAKQGDSEELKVSGSYLQTLITYSALKYNYQLPEEGAKTEMVYLIGTKSPKILRQPVTVTQKQVDTLVNKALVQSSILDQNLVTTNRGCTFCKEGSGGCSYFSECHSEF